MIQRFRSTFACAALAGLFGAMALAQPAAFQETHGQWTIAGDARAGACIAQTAPSWNGVEMVIASVPTEKEYRFALKSAAWQSLRDGPMKLDALFLDAEDDITDFWKLSVTGTSAQAGGPRINWTILRAKNDRANFMDQLGQGHALWFLVDEVPIAKFDLAGSAKAIGALERCRSMLRAEPDFDPFAQ